MADELTREQLVERIKTLEAKLAARENNESDPTKKKAVRLQAIIGVIEFRVCELALFFFERTTHQ